MKKEHHSKLIPYYDFFFQKLASNYMMFILKYLFVKPLSEDDVVRIFKSFTLIHVNTNQICSLLTESTISKGISSQELNYVKEAFFYTITKFSTSINDTRRGY